MPVYRNLKKWTQVTPESLSSIVRYDSEAGKIYWKPRPEVDRFSKAFNTRYAGEEAGYINSQGYKVLNLEGEKFLTHLIVVFLETGVVPDNEYDHRNGVRLDNRFSNLRPCTRSENCCNRPIAASNKLGIKGVAFSPQTGKWRAHINMNGQQFTKRCDTQNEAIDWRRQMEEKLHGTFSRSTRSP